MLGFFRSKFFRLLGLFAICFLVFVQLAFAGSQDVVSKVTVWAWLVNHWTAVGLILSEIASLFSEKYSGIIKTIWELLKPRTKK